MTDELSTLNEEVPEELPVQEEKPLSREEIEQLVVNITRPLVQSQVDKAENRISRSAREQIDALRVTQKALNLTDDQVTNASQRIIMDDLMQASQARQANQDQPDTEDQLDPVIAETLQVFQSEGVTITTSDPEYQALDNILRDPNGNINKYRRELYRQIDAKRDRISRSGEKANARVVGGGSKSTSDPNDISQITDSKELYKLGANKVGRKT